MSYIQAISGNVVPICTCNIAFSLTAYFDPKMAILRPCFNPLYTKYILKSMYYRGRTYYIYKSVVGLP